MKFRAPLSVSIAIAVGVIVLLGYFFGTDGAGQPTILGILRDYFLHGAVIVAGVALLVGVFNLSAAHMKKIRQGEGAVYSVVTLVALILTLLVGIFDLTLTYKQGEPGLRWTRWIFENIQLPIETSLMAILVVSLTYAATRLLSRRLTFMSAVFSAFVFILLVTAIPALAASLGLIADLHNWITSVLAVGGARGLLFGVALGTVATGIRILMGVDRPYGG